MDDAVIGAVRQILELGWPAISLIQTWILWRALRERTAEYLAHLVKCECSEPEERAEAVTEERFYHSKE